MFLIASIPHTGTHLCKHIFCNVPKRPRLQIKYGRLDPEVWIPDGWFHEHITQESMRFIRHWAQAVPVIVPMRHPIDVAVSWVTRNKKIGDLIDEYRRLFSIDRDYELLYLPIDTPDREEWLEKIDKKMEWETKTNFPVIKSIGKKQELTTREAAEIGAFVTENMEFFSRFYR